MKLTLAEKKKEILKFTKTQDNGEGDIILKIKKSSFYKENPTEFFMELLYNFLKNSSAFREDILDFFINEIKQSKDNQIINKLEKNSFLTANLIKTYNDIFYFSEKSALLVSALKDKGYFDSFDLETYIDFINNNGLVFVQNSHNAFIFSKEKEYIKNQTFSLIIENKDIPSYITKITPILRTCFQNDLFTNDELLDFIFLNSSELSDKIKFDYLNTYGSFSFIQNKENEIVSMIKDDFNFFNTYLEKDLLLALKGNKTGLLLNAGSSVKNMNLFLQNYSEEEVSDLLKDFQKDYPNLYKNLFLENKKIMKSKNLQVKTSLEKIIIKMNTSDFIENKSICKKRL